MSVQLIRKEILNFCFNLYLVIALGKCANASSVLLQSLYNLLRSREGMQTGEDRVHDMKHSHIILPEENQNQLSSTDIFQNRFS